MGICHTWFLDSQPSDTSTSIMPVATDTWYIQKLLDRKNARHDIRRENSILNYLMIKIFSIESKLLPYFSLPFGVSIVTIADKKSNMSD